ncbi:MAG: glycosyltransferase 87 family protein [Thermoanaerobaculia bacterium]
MGTRARLLVLAVFAAALAFAAEPLLTGRGTDIRNYLEAARALRAGHDPYAGIYPYLYPPLLAVVVVPLTFLPSGAAAWVWATASAAALASSAGLVAKGSPRVLLLALLFAPLAATQWNLQANAFVLLLLVLARDRLDAGFEAGGGALLGVSIALKPFGLLAAPALFLVGRWRAGLAAVGAALLSFALIVPFTGLAGAAAAGGAVKRILSSSWVETYGANVSLNGSFDRFFPNGAGSERHGAVGLAIAGSTLLLVATAAAGAARGGKRLRSSAVVDAALAATLLGAPTSWLHHSTVLLPAVAALPPAAQPAAVALYGVAAAWRGFTSLGAGAGVAASLAGTVALVLVWLLACRRAAEPC